MRQFILRNIFNAIGLSTKQKIIVIESDDWGAIRMPSVKTYDNLIKNRVISINDSFAKFDGLASENDLYLLYDVLSSIKDYNGKNPVLTANCIMANPDFSKIKQNNYQKYFFEPIENTFKKYPKHEKCLDIWKEGMNFGVFKPQLHGREHVNVNKWIKLLQNKNRPFLHAFEQGTYAINSDIVASFNYSDLNEKNLLKNIINDACNLFEATFGFKSKTFIAPNYTWDFEVEQLLFSNTINYIQGSKTQKLPNFKGKNKKKINYFGRKNKLDQTYLVRNCFFEPSLSNSINCVDQCMKQISNSFYWNMPAIISSHRLNFVGYLSEQNRDNNLRSLKKLLSNIVLKWPDVIFLSTDELIDFIKK